MNIPPKPELQRQYREGQNGEIISELTPQSEADYTRWLRACNLAKIAINKAE